MVFVKCDVRNWQDQVNVFKTAIAKSPRHGIDIVVANAGVSGSDEFYEGTLYTISADDMTSLAFHQPSSPTD